MTHSPTTKEGEGGGGGVGNERGRRLWGRQLSGGREQNSGVQDGGEDKAPEVVRMAVSSASGSEGKDSRDEGRSWGGPQRPQPSGDGRQLLEKR